MNNVGKGERSRLRRAIVVGAGRAGLAATLELVARDIPVLLIAEGPSFQAGSTRDREGFNAASERERDSAAQHAKDTQNQASGLVSEQALVELCARAPQLAQWLLALGVPFVREASGGLSRVKLSGSSRARTLHVTANTGRYLISALDALVRTQQGRAAQDERGMLVPGEKLVRRLDHWRFVSLVFDDHGAVVGVLAQDTRTLACKAFAGDGVILATGDYAAQYKEAASSASGAALGAVYAQGAVLSNLEFVQHSATVVVRGGASVALPEFLLAAGARVTGRGKAAAHLDLTALEPERVAHLAESLGHPLMKILGAEFGRETLRLERRALRGLGGLWVDADPALPADGFSPRQHATNLPGLYACGAVAAEYHGARALPGNLACADILGGQLSARAVVCYREAQAKSAFDLPKSLFDKPAAAADSDFEAMLKRERKEGCRGPHQLLSALRSEMARHAGPSRSGQGLEQLMTALGELQQEAERSSVQGPDNGLNQDALLLASLPSMLRVAQAVVAAALAREESRGEHQRSDFAEKSAEYERPSLIVRAADGEPELISSFEYESVGQQVKVLQP